MPKKNFVNEKFINIPLRWLQQNIMPFVYIQKTEVAVKISTSNLRKKHRQSYVGIISESEHIDLTTPQS